MLRARVGRLLAQLADADAAAAVGARQVAALTAIAARRADARPALARLEALSAPLVCVSAVSRCEGWSAGGAQPTLPAARAAPGGSSDLQAVRAKVGRVLQLIAARRGELRRQRLQLGALETLLSAVLLRRACW